MKILVFGSLNVDRRYIVDHFVQPGETLSSLSVGTFSGGKGLNQAIACKKLAAMFIWLVKSAETALSCWQN